MKTFKLLLLPGDGIGPEVMREVEKLLVFFRQAGLVGFETESDLVGGAAYDAHKMAITDATMKLARMRTLFCSAQSAARSGPRSLTSIARKPHCCACARISGFSPIFARPSVIRRSLRPPP